LKNIFLQSIQINYSLQSKLINRTSLFINRIAIYFSTYYVRFWFYLLYF